MFSMRVSINRRRLVAINTRFNPIPHKPSRDLNRLLKNVFEAADARQKQAKKRSLCPINEHFEPVFNAAAATQIVFQQPVSAELSLMPPI